MSTFLTPSIIAKTGIVALRNNLVLGGLVWKDFSKDFAKVGDTITVEKPNTFSVVEFDGSLAGHWQEASKSSTTLEMDTLLTVPIQVSAQDLTLSVRNFYGQIMEPALQAMAQEVDVRIARLYKDIPYGMTANTTTAVADITGIRKIQSELKVPQKGRVGVLSPLTFATLLNLAEFRDLDKTGETAVLKEASMGRRFGYDLYESQNIQTHAIGSSSVAGAIDGGNVSKGDTTIHIDSLASADTIAKGTILTIVGNTGQYVITADVVLSGNEADFPIYPGLNADITSSDVTAFRASATTGKENLFFHPHAFTMVSAPMEPPMGGAKGASANFEGMSLNITYDYDINEFKNKLVVSLLCGFKTIQPELATRLYDAS